MSDLTIFPADLAAICIWLVPPFPAPPSNFSIHCRTIP